MRFRAALTYTVLGLALAPTFARTAESTLNATVRDHLGCYQACMTGELRFLGARRVGNLIADSEGFSTGWTLGSSTSKAAAGEAGAQGRQTVQKLTRTSGSGPMLTLNSTTYRPGQHTFSLHLRADAPASYTIKLVHSSDSAVIATSTVTVGTTLARYGVFGTVADATNHRVEIAPVASGAQVLYVDSAQMERTVGQDGAPNDYVPRGAAGAASPYNGAYVDGVQYFDTTNPWTISSGVCTLGTGAAIATATMLGAMTEKFAVNTIYSSAALEAAEWTKTNVSAAALATATVLGYGYMRRLTEIAVNAAHTVTQAWRTTLPTNGRVISASAIFPTPSGGGRSWVYIAITDKAGATCRQWFDITNGVVGSVSGGSNVEAVIYQESGNWIAGLSCNCGTGASAPIMEIGIATADGVSSYLGDITKYVDVAMPQFELADHPTSRIVESGSASANTRGFDDLRINVPAGTFRSSDWCVTVDWTPMFRTSIANKVSFYYLWYHVTSAIKRFGVSLRPGTLGGGSSDALADDINGDIYPNDAAFDGVNYLTLTKQPYETVKVGYAACPSLQTGSSNLAGTVDGHTMVATVTATPRVNVLDWDPVVIQIGAQDVVGAQNPVQSQCIKNFVVTVGKSATQQVAA